MSKFNTTLPKQSTKTINLAGGEAYKQSDKLAFVSLLLTSFVSDQFYRTANKSLEDLKKLMSSINDKKFIAKAAIYARDEFGMRSISHAIAGELTSDISGTEWSKNFYDRIVERLDDMTEIMSYYMENKTDKKAPKFPNSLKKGFANAFQRFDNYQIAKYTGKNKFIKLVDIVNLVHPTPTDRNKESLNLLVNGKLKNTETWEAKLSKAGQIASDSEDLEKLKSDAWNDLLASKKLGYMAALKNARNIITQAPNCVDMLCSLLTNTKMIANSKVLPFRFTTAYDEISKLPSTTESRKLLQAINVALDLSTVNVPKFEGNTLVVLDVSGSMKGKPSEIASLFGAMIAKVNNCDLMTFDNYARYESYNPMDSITTIKGNFNFTGGGTNFKDIFIKANKAYENVIILSDMQAWMGMYTPAKEFNDYKNKFDCEPYLYSWDLQGLTTMQFPENKVFCLSGFSEKVFDIMGLLKTDKNALINKIESISL